MLTLEGLTKYKSKKDLVSALNRGEITEKELSRVYSSFRKRNNAQIKSIQGSDIPFLPGTVPYMSKKINIVTTSALVDQISSGLRFFHSKSYTKTQRKEQRRVAVAKLAEHGIHIAESEWGSWRRFMAWFHQTEFASLYDSDSDATQEIFNANPKATGVDWQRLFIDWMRENEPERFRKWVETGGAVFFHG